MSKPPEDLIDREVLPMLFSKRVPEITYYRNAADVQRDPHLSVISRKFILGLLDKGVAAVCVVPRSDLDTTVDE